MKKCAIITINNSNYGNRLQNYALQEFLKDNKYKVETIKNVSFLNKKKNKINYLLRSMVYLVKKNDFVDTKKRENNFKEFNKEILFSKKVFNWFNYKWMDKFDYFIIGSDQVWNPNYRLTDFDLGSFTTKDKLVSFSASIGINELDTVSSNRLKNSLNGFKAISVREDSGKTIINELLPNTKIEVLIDPTMLLSSTEWKKVEKKPKLKVPKKYILNYFLGEKTLEINKIISNYAKENNLDIINILDKEDPFYECGPSEFLYLERNATLICTDSFHSAVFSIIFKKNFVVFDRVQINHKNMNSRIHTLLNKFDLQCRLYDKNFKFEDIDYNSLEIDNILKEEKIKSINFLNNSLK